MKIKHYKDGTADLVFEEHEKKIINEKGFIYFDEKALKEFGNMLVAIASEFHLKNNKPTKKNDL